MANGGAPGGGWGPPPPGPLPGGAPGWPPSPSNWPPPWIPPHYTEPLAVAALVAGIAALGLFFLLFVPLLVGTGAIATGVAALNRIRRDAERQGKGMAIAGVVLGSASLVVAGGLAFLIVGSSTGTRLDHAHLRVGDCFTFSADSFDRVFREQCSQAHGAEVVGTVLLDAQPMRDDLTRYVRADRACDEPFRSYVGQPSSNEGLTQQALIPTEEEWQGGFHTVVCIADDARGDSLVGSVRGRGSAPRPVGHPVG